MSSGEMSEAIRGAARGGIERAADGTIRQRYVFEPAFPAFRGHFPGRPVLPAVLQIMAASQLVSDAVGGPLLPVSVERAKFVTPIPPQTPVQIACRRRGGADSAVWDVSIDCRGQAAASFALELRAPAAGA